MSSVATWARSYEDILQPEDSSALPMYGWRIIVFSDNEGNEYFRFVSEGEPSIASTVAILEQVKFVVQAKGFLGDEG